MDGIFAKRTAQVKPSTIREILEVATRPEVISFQAFQYCEPRFVPAPTDGDCLVAEALPELIAKYRPKLLYIADLHTSTFAQHVVYRYLMDNRTDEHIARIRAAYGQRYAAMDEALRAEMPAGFSWTHPEGGMFLWVTGPEELDAEKILPAAIERRVAFVPGRDFFRIAAAATACG